MKDSFRSLLALAAMSLMSLMSIGVACIVSVRETASSVYRWGRDTFEYFTFRLVAAMPAMSDESRSPSIVRLIVAKAYKATTEKRERPVIFERFRMCPSC